MSTQRNPSGTARPAYKVMLVAGEPSGDALGAQLMTALKRLADRPLIFSGVGGQAMMAAGLRSLYPIDDLAIMGLRQIVPRLPKLLMRIRQTVRAGLAADADVAILIDSGDFNYRVARGLKRSGFRAPIVKYVSAQIWASRPGRAAKIARVFDHVMTLLPFEPPYYVRVGLPATYVGHPVTERPIVRQAGAEFRARHGIASDAKLLVVLPGSRVSEIRYLLPIFAETVSLLMRRCPELNVVVPTVRHIAEPVRDAVAHWRGTCRVVEGDDHKYAAFEASDAALAASGTVALELAIAGVPMVIAYRVGWLTGRLAQALVTVRFITLINLILGKEAVPEFVQQRCRADLLAPAVHRLLTDDEARARQKEALHAAVSALRADGEPPSVRAATTVLNLVRRRDGPVGS